MIKDDHCVSCVRGKENVETDDPEERMIPFPLNVFFSQMDFRLELSHSPGIEKFDVELEGGL